MMMIYGGPPRGPGGRLDPSIVSRLEQIEADLRRGPYFLTLGDQPDVSTRAERGKARLYGGPYDTLDKARREGYEQSRSLRRWMDDEGCELCIRTNDSAIVERVHFKNEPPSAPFNGSAFGRSQTGRR